MKQYRFAVWSNAAFLAPLVLAASVGLWPVVAALVVLIVFSVLFHSSGERQYALADTLASYVAVATAGWLVLAGTRQFELMLGLPLLVCMGLAVRHMVEKGRRGSTAHGFWHVVAAAAFWVCLWSYLGS